MFPHDHSVGQWTRPPLQGRAPAGAAPLEAEAVSKVVFHVSGRGDEGLETLTITRRELADYLGTGVEGTIDDYFAAAMRKYGPASTHAYDLMGRFLFEVVPYAETDEGIVEQGAFLVGKPWGDHLPLGGPRRPSRRVTH